ncbi:putative MFS-type transporter YcaD [Pseudovibrio axinellae]|uniref:Putative MFS-type transporter YcaD n=1 Tax=Pseudovibrio axinellae TaxID=989403 RepID=A0A165TWB6_9HYPH|nr:MFS transporter [Pseudovibrio axinellae]KZL06713.1 putative MFS-type transporter YcaD [Pseudovibrio axinellae]SER61519.1 Cyanate permease [Pseudovibrio axinellae]
MVQTSDTAAPTLSRDQLRGIIAAIAAITAVGLSLSASLPLLTLTLEARGISATWIGINTAFSGVAAIISTPTAPYLARKLGTPQTLILSLLIAGFTLPLFFLAENFWIWFPLRLMFNGATTIAFILSEFWINSQVPPKHRGLFLGAYTTVLSVGVASGPLILVAVGTVGITPFLLAGSCIMLATLPVMIGLNVAPKIQGQATSNLLGFLWMAPIATLAGFVCAAVEQSSISLLPLFGLQTGLTPERATLLVSAMAAGNILLQIPLGALADRMSLRLLMIFCGALGCVGALLMIPLSGSFTAILILLFVWGGLVAGLYTIGLTHLGTHYTGANLASANAAFALMYAMGQLTGPAATGVALSELGSNGLPLIFAGILGVYVIICLIRRTRVGAGP